MVAVRTPWLTDVVTVVTHFGDTIVATAITVALVLALLRRNRTVDAVMVGGAMASGFLLMSGVKLVFGRDRPPVPVRLVHEITHSFPSGHAMMSAILVCVVGAVVVRVTGRLRPIVAAGLALWTLAIGLSRVYLAAHWFTDVLAGWVLGITWAAVWIAGSAWFARTRGVSGDSGETVTR
ncbi:phosphatase PAP2 family protein [Rhodococcus gannanensis]|uniref:Phosphatase PAP2 family protein n=1 Tax=Rhodococcus gannanensis TaxID=1960308 RepID=A0ABW4NXD2_9NOCA